MTFVVKLGWVSTLRPKAARLRGPPPKDVFGSFPNPNKPNISFRIEHPLLTPFLAQISSMVDSSQILYKFCEFYGVVKRKIISLCEIINQNCSNKHSHLSSKCHKFTSSVNPQTRKAFLLETKLSGTYARFFLGSEYLDVKNKE